MTIITAINNHIEQAIDRLLAEFQDSESRKRIRQLVEAITASVQAVEDVAMDVLLTQGLADSIGEQLNTYGKILREGREGLGDTAYRALLRTKIRANRSNGNPEEIAGVLSEIVGVPVRYILAGDASYRLIYEVATPIAAAIRARAKKIMLAIRPAGVELNKIVETQPDAFRFAGGPGPPRGFGVGVFRGESI